MVFIKPTTSLAVLLGSAAISSAAALPASRRGADPESPSKRSWKGKLGARGPWRQENDHYLINLDLTGDGAHRNGHGHLIDLNTRTDLSADEEELLHLQLEAQAKRNEPILSIGQDDSGVIAQIKARDEPLLDLSASILTGSDKASKWLSSRDIDLSGLESAAKNAGVTDDQLIAAKNAVDSLSPDQKVQVENAVKHAMFAVTKPGEKKRRSMPGPAFLRKARAADDEVVEMINKGGNVRVEGDEVSLDTGVVSTDNAEQRGAPLLAQPNAKRSVAEEMGGAPGYIDITSPVFNSTAQRLASLVLSTSNGTSENSTFVLNASSSVRTQVFLVPINSTESGGAEPKEGEPIKVNLKVPVFVAESAEVEPFCATFDPSPDAPEPMTVEPCSEPEDERSQIFLFDPETGAVKPDWTPTTEENKEILAKVSDSVSSEMPSSTASALSSAVTASSSASPSAIRSISAAPTVAPTASATASITSSLSDLGVMSALPLESVSVSEASISSAAASATATAIASIVSAAPLESAIISETLSSIETVPTSASDIISAEAAPTASASATSAIPSVASSLPTSTPLSVPLPSESAASPSVPAPVASATQKAASSGNNVTLIFTPSNASVQSSDDDEEASPVSPVHSVKAKRSEHAHVDTDDDCNDSLIEISAVAGPLGGLANHPAASAAPASASASPKPKAKAPKLPEGAKHANEASNKVHLVHGDVQVENVQSLAGRMVVRNWKRQQQKVMMVSQTERDMTAPYQ